MKVAIYTDNIEETMALGEKLGKKLRAGDVIALFGDLGAGKTTLTKGIAAGMGLSADIHSPTFTLIHEHPGEIPLYHIDLYRLTKEEDVEWIGIDEYIFGNGVTIIEWADRMKSLLPEDRLDITLSMKGDTERELIFETYSPRMMAVVEGLTKDADNSN